MKFIVRTTYIDETRGLLTENRIIESEGAVEALLSVARLDQTKKIVFVECLDVESISKNIKQALNR